MSMFNRPCRRFLFGAVLALALGAGASAPAFAQIHCFPDSVLPFPRIAVCAFPGHFQDSTLIQNYRCPGSFAGPLPDSVREDARAITVRFKRDRRAEARSDFGGYRIYRVTNRPDTASMVLIRRFSRQDDDTLLSWHFSVVDSSPSSSRYLQFICQGQVMHDSIVAFVDPDSNGAFVKECRRVDNLGRCLTIGDSVMVLKAPPGPHDGFRTWYAITYEAYNRRDRTYEDLFVPDTSDWSRCGVAGNPGSCPNLNAKATNLISTYVEPTGGPTVNLERVGVVPNPYRGRAPWDPQGGNEVHFTNLPVRSTIKIYTIAGDLVRTLQHSDRVRDFERWDLTNQDGQSVASGIYMYRVESGTFTFQSRLVVIR